MENFWSNMQQLEKAGSIADHVTNFLSNFLDETMLFQAIDYNLVYIYNFGHNVLRLFDVSPNFSFTTSETNRDY